MDGTGGGSDEAGPPADAATPPPAGDGGGGAGPGGAITDPGATSEPEIGPTPAEAQPGPHPTEPDGSPSPAAVTPTPVPGEPEGEPGAPAEVVFPIAAVDHIDASLAATRWSVPIHENGSLEQCLLAYSQMLILGKADEDVGCVRFVNTSLVASFHKLLSSTAVQSWPESVQLRIRLLTALLCDIVVDRLLDDVEPLLGLVLQMFDAGSTFHVQNCRRYATSTIAPNSTDNGLPQYLDEDQLFAIEPTSSSIPCGWLVDLVNRFGSRGGFTKILERLGDHERNPINSYLLSCLIKPWGNCAEYLTRRTLTEFGIPARAIAVGYLASLEGEGLKNETKNLTRQDSLSGIISALKALRPEDSDDGKELDSLLLNTILKLLKGSSFNGIMYALNEMKRIIARVRQHWRAPKDWLVKETLADWMIENDLLGVLFRDNLHKAQYVAKLEDIVKFLMMEKRLTLTHLSDMWELQIGKHDVIVNNIFDLLAKLAWNFETEQLDHLFLCFQQSWGGTPKQMESQLEFIRRLAEDDTEGNMALKVLDVLWILAHEADTPISILEAANHALIKILEGGSFRDRDVTRLAWMTKCIDDLRARRWVVPALRCLKAIAKLYPEGDSNRSYAGRVRRRHEVLEYLDSNLQLKQIVVGFIDEYAAQARDKFKAVEPSPELASSIVLGKFDHNTVMDEILAYLKHLLWDGQLWLEAGESVQIWTHLISNAPCDQDRERGLKWFDKAMSKDPDLSEAARLLVFKEKVLQTDPTGLTLIGFLCFIKFFQHCSALVLKGEHPEATGLEQSGSEYLWRVALESPNQQIATSAIHRLKYSHTSEMDKLPQTEIKKHHCEFIEDCMSRLSEAFFCVTRNPNISDRERQDSFRRIERCLVLLEQYVADCDHQHDEQRMHLPHGVAFRGPETSLVVQFAGEEFRLELHSNCSIMALRQHIAQRTGISEQRLKLLVQQQELSPSCDRDVLRGHKLTSGSVVEAQQVKEGSSVALSMHGRLPVDAEAEALLPGMLIVEREDYLIRLFELAELDASAAIQARARSLLMAVPTDQQLLRTTREVLEAGGPAAEAHLKRLLFDPSCFRTKYVLETLSELVEQRHANFLAQFAHANGCQFLLDILTGAPPKEETEEQLSDRRNTSRLCVSLVHFAIRFAVQTEDAAWTEDLDQVFCSDAFVKVAWRAATGRFSRPADLDLTNPTQDYASVSEEDISLAAEALGAVKVLLFIGPDVRAKFFKKKNIKVFVRDTLLLAHERVRRPVQRILTSLAEVPDLFANIWKKTLSYLPEAEACPEACAEYFETMAALIAQALKAPHSFKWKPLLAAEVAWLKAFAAKPQPVDTPLLAGHFQLCAALLRACPGEKKGLGTELLELLLTWFLFPASQLLLLVRQGKAEGRALEHDRLEPPCTRQPTRIAAFSLVAELTTGCAANFEATMLLLNQLHFGEQDKIDEWDYHPPIAPKASSGLVGLKNAGATCYMNSVLQQLFMQPDLKSLLPTMPAFAEAATEEEREANIMVQLQRIFTHLSGSAMQSHAPEGFWKAYRHYGEPVNVREQQDAREFLDNVFDQVDEKLKAAQQPKLFERVFGGVLADQKIIKNGCTHTYEREEPFMMIIVEIRNNDTLQESLEQFVKGDLLEGANQYRCEKCDVKRDTVKRSVIKRLPRVLTFHLKRFDYDWERGIPVKFNDRFEFPAEIDMAPYTVEGMLAKEIADAGGETGGAAATAMYTLAGVLVHSGQANGGHYYSFVRGRDQTGAFSDTDTWYKFDDSEVSEWNANEPMSQEKAWFGGEFESRVWDPAFKRMLPRRRERWWSAYILFYERRDLAPLEAAPAPPSTMLSLSREVQESNLIFQHQRSVFNTAYFNFIQQLAGCNQKHWSDKKDPSAKKLAMLSSELTFKFLFSYTLRTVRTIRGQVHNWIRLFGAMMMASPDARRWFVSQVVGLKGVHRQCILESSSQDLRTSYCTMIHYLVLSTTAQDKFEAAKPLIDCILEETLLLLGQDASESWKGFGNMFKLLNDYAALGIDQRQHLLEQRVFEHSANLILSEHSWNKYQMPDMGPVVALLSTLARSLDFQGYLEQQRPEQALSPNPFFEQTAHQNIGRCEPLLSPSPAICQLLFHPQADDLIATCLALAPQSVPLQVLLQFCCWQNQAFSAQIIMVLLRRIDASLSSELQALYNQLLAVLSVEDAFQAARIKFALRQQQDSLYMTLAKHRQRHPKKTYLCLKFLKLLHDSLPCARAQLLETLEQWIWAPTWLYTQLTRHVYPQYDKRPPTSNEAATGYNLERSASATNLFHELKETFPEHDFAAPLQAETGLGPAESDDDDYFQDGDDIDADGVSSSESEDNTDGIRSSTG